MSKAAVFIFTFFAIAFGGAAKSISSGGLRSTNGDSCLDGCERERETKDNFIWEERKNVYESEQAKGYANPYTYNWYQNYEDWLTANRASNTANYKQCVRCCEAMKNELNSDYVAKCFLVVSSFNPTPNP